MTDHRPVDGEDAAVDQHQLANFDRLTPQRQAEAIAVAACRLRSLRN